MSRKTASNVLEHEHKTKKYYDSSDANNFYMKLWGGVNLHIGLHNDNLKIDDIDNDQIIKASIRTTDHLLSLIPVEKMNHIADLGAGIGDTARRICHLNNSCCVDCFEISEKENKTDFLRNKKEHLTDRITIKAKSYLSTEEPNNTYDAIVSQDAFLHCANKELLVKEVARILKPGGYFAFTDPMQTDFADVKKLQPIYERVLLSSMGSPGFYIRESEKNGLRFMRWENHRHQMERQYLIIHHLLQKHGKECGISQEYIDKALFGLQKWVDGVRENNLVWGYLVFQKH